MNLRQLGLELLAYGNEHGEFPPAERWCDLLVDQYCRRTGELARKFRQSYRCPKVDKDAWGYSMNALANGRSGPDVVLLFESDAGWNSFGGPELLTTSHHENRVCNVFFVDGSIRFVKAEEVASLRWGQTDESK